METNILRNIFATLEKNLPPLSKYGWLFNRHFVRFARDLVEITQHKEFESSNTADTYKNRIGNN